MSSLSLDLSASAKVIKREMVCRNWKWRILTVLVVLIVIYFVLVIACGGFSLSGCI